MKATENPHKVVERAGRGNDLRSAAHFNARLLSAAEPETTAQFELQRSGMQLLRRAGIQRFAEATSLQESLVRSGVGEAADIDLTTIDLPDPETDGTGDRSRT
jgi:hypothetical protein